MSLFHSHPVKRFLIIIVITAATLSPLWSVDAVPGGFPLVNQGHQSPVNATAIQAESGLAFSGSSDGVLKVWDTEGRRLIQRIQVSAQPIIMIAANPSRNEVAIIQEWTLGTYRLSVWDWVDQRMSFARTLEDLPIFLEYSPQGRFLSMAVPQWRSMRFYETARAREVNYLQDGFGIVNFAAISSSETRIMTYSANSGVIRYLELSSGELNHQTQTVRDLSQFTLLANRRHALGVRSGELYLVDVVNGATLARTSVGDVREIIPIDPDGNTLYLVEQSGGRNRLIPLEVSIGERSADLRISRTASVGISGFSTYFRGGTSGGVFAADNGNIGLIRSGGYDLMGLSALSRISTVVTLGEWMYILSEDSVSRFPESILDETFAENGDRPLGEESGALIERLNLPISSPGGMTALNNVALLIWDRESTNSIIEYNSFSGQSRRIPVSLRAPVRNIRIGDRYIIIIDGENGLYLLDRNDYSQTFSYNTLGLIDAIELDSGLILIGKNQSGFFNSSLIEVNPRTSETSVVDSSDTVVFEFSENPSGRGFYSIGVSNENDRSYTIVREYSSGRPEDSRSIMRFNGEDTDASLEYSGGSNSLITSAGLDGVSLYQSRRLQSLEKNNNLPREVFGAGNRIFAVNIDGSLSVWNSRNRQLTHQILGLPNGDLVILNEEAAYLALETQPGSPVVNYDQLLIPVIPDGSREPRLNRLSFRNAVNAAETNVPSAQDEGDGQDGGGQDSADAQNPPEGQDSGENESPESPAESEPGNG
jgi:hypothetical protein